MRHPAPSDPPLQTNARATWTDQGEGAPVVALHGLPGSARNYRRLGSLLELELRLVRLETPGFGACPALETMDASHCVDHFLRSMDDLQLEKVVVLGHSFGGALAVGLAAAAPDRVAGLALLAPIGLSPHRLWRKSVLVMKALNRLRGLPGMSGPATLVTHRAFRSVGLHCTRDETRAALAMIAAWRFADHRTAASQVRCPVFAASATDDAFVEPPVIAELLAALPPGPHRIFPEGGHFLQNSKAPQIAKLLIPWVQKRLATRAARD